MTRKFTAIANVNFALSKYWGKRDPVLNLPATSSLSVTIDNLESVSTVQADSKLSYDELILNDNLISKDSLEFKDQIEPYLNYCRSLAKTKDKFKIKSKNNFPTGAGLASSASGFAAMSVAINQVLELGLDTKGLSVLARRGSGSATRSILGGFNIWNKGKLDDGSDSHIESVASGDFWPDLRVLVCVTEEERKKNSSRVGMSQTAETSRIFQKLWLNQAEQDLLVIKDSILNRDFEQLGFVAEKNSQLMHATMLESSPPLIYFNDTALKICTELTKARSQGLSAYYTMDAGPQVKILCLENSLSDVEALVNLIPGIKSMRVCKPANENARLLDSHLF